jgi:hypothetical protein
MKIHRNERLSGNSFTPKTVKSLTLDNMRRKVKPLSTILGNQVSKSYLHRSLSAVEKEAEI